MTTKGEFYFISYTRRDTPAMRRMVSFLRDNGMKVWVDNEILIPGTPIWEEEIEKAIKDCAGLIVLLSPDAKNSEWVRREISFAEQLQKRIYPILLRGNAEESIPLSLTTRQYINLQNNEEDGLHGLIYALRGPFEVFSKSEINWDTYKSDLEKSPTRPILEAKIILVGQGGVGKTSLVKNLVYGEFNPHEGKTDGISIIRWELPDRNIKPSSNGNNNQDVRINIWDFGGQEIMHATHQFFLTKRSLYLLVLDARLGQDENRIEYWLRLIQSFGGDSPIIIVGNKVDHQPLDIDRRGLRNKYPNIKAIVETSCSKGIGIAGLRDMLSREISALQHVHDELPMSWFTVKDEVASIDSDFIEYSAYQSICQKNNVIDQKSQQALIGFLHDLGVAVYFQDDPRLEALGILNPEWVTNGVYRILNSFELFQNKGVLEHRYIGQILDLNTYSRQHQLFIVDMMQKFELCLKFDGAGETTYLIPDILPREEPYTGDWQQSLEFEFHYTILPSSVISRFIVRMHPFIHQNTLWRSGLVLRKEDNLALIKADYADNIISIKVSGRQDTKRDLLAIVRGTLESIHRTIPGLELEEKIPVPGYPKADSLKYTDLLLFEYGGRKNLAIAVDGAIVDVNLQNLLDHVENRASRNARTETLPLKPIKQGGFQKLIKPVNTLATYIGRFIFDIFGRNETAESSTMILGYIFLIISTLLLIGFFNIDEILKTFKENWRFFFPEPK